MSEMIKRVARAIDPELFNFPQIELYRSNYEKVYAQARAAIEAMREPTEAMAGACQGMSTDWYGYADIWQRMIDAALCVSDGDAERRDRNGLGPAGMPARSDEVGDARTPPLQQEG